MTDFKTLRLVLGGATLLAAGAVLGRLTAPGASRPRDVLSSGSRLPAAQAHVSAAAAPIPRQPALDETHARAADAIERLRRIGDKPASGAAFDQLLAALRDWARVDPASASAYALKHLAHGRQTQALVTVLSAWTADNPAAAWSWATTNTPANNTCLDAILNRVGQDNPATAWGYASDFARTHPADAQSVYASALRGIAYSGNFEQAVQLLSSARDLTDGARNGLATLVATEWGRYAPEAAVAWAQQLPAGGIASERAMINVVQTWAENDPAAAARFAGELPPGSTRRQTLTQAFGNWANEDPDAAARWLFSQQTGPDFDQAIKTLSTHPKVIAQPEAALSLALSITEPELRTQSLCWIISSWQSRAPADAEQFLRTSPEIAPETRSAVIARLKAGDIYNSDGSR